MVPFDYLKTLLGDDQDNSADPQTSSGLYECPVCETVYISEGMQSCPECEESVENVPNEQELGLR